MYPDKWEAAADRAVTVYVPSRTADQTVLRIAPESGIVGRPWPEVPDRVEICYEGNLYDAVNLRTYLERVQCAAGRLITGYPTVARAYVHVADLVEVGTFVPRTKELRVTNPEALHAWAPDSDTPASPDRFGVNEMAEYLARVCGRPEKQTHVRLVLQNWIDEGLLAIGKERAS